MHDITKVNIDKYRSGMYPDIKEIRWKAGSLDVDVLCVFPNLKHLSLAFNQLTSLKGLEGCPQLRILSVGSNKLETLEGLEGCPRLQYLSFTHNKITSLAELRHTPSLLQLDCTNNRLRSLAGIEYCPLLTKLDCSLNKLESLEGLSSCVLLQEIRCGFNCVSSFNGIQGCVQLRNLSCYNSKLVTLTGIENCGQLLHLFCSDNKLTDLLGLKGCPRLQVLDCSGNKLTSLAGLNRCPELVRLECDRNHLKALTGIEMCTQLKTLSCNRNYLQALTGIEMCTQLKTLSCIRNQLTTLNQLVYLRQLRSVSYSNNPLDVQTIQIQRLLNMMKRPILDRSVYSDGQNVHNIHIQKCVCESVQNLLKDPKPEFSVEMIVESGMDERAIRLLLEYCDDESIHSAHLLSFKELLSYVWARISKSEHTTELIRILAEQMCDSECKCFTGRINRLVSVLVGFYPDITIEISDTSRIGLSSSLLKGRLTSMILSSIENTQRSYLQRLAIPRLRSNLGWRQS